MTTAELFQTEAFMKCLWTTVFWVVAYILVRYLSSRAGVGHLLKTAVKKTKGLRKSVLQLRYLCTSKSATQHLAKAVRVFHKVLRRQKGVSKVLNMYLFDDRGDMDVADAKRMIDAIPDICRDVLVKIAEEEDPDMNPRFDEIEINIKTAVELVKKADTIDLKKKILKI